MQQKRRKTGEILVAVLIALVVMAIIAVVLAIVLRKPATPLSVSGAFGLESYEISEGEALKLNGWMIASEPASIGIQLYKQTGESVSTVLNYRPMISDAVLNEHRTEWSTIGYLIEGEEIRTAELQLQPGNYQIRLYPCSESAGQAIYGSENTLCRLDFVISANENALSWNDDPISIPEETPEETVEPITIATATPTPRPTRDPRSTEPGMSLPTPTPAATSEPRAEKPSVQGINPSVDYAASADDEEALVFNADLKLESEDNLHFTLTGTIRCDADVSYVWVKVISGWTEGSEFSCTEMNLGEAGEPLYTYQIEYGIDLSELRGLFRIEILDPEQKYTICELSGNSDGRSKIHLNPSME